MKKAQDPLKIKTLESRLDKKNREIRALKKINMLLRSLYDGVSEEIMVIDQDLIINDINRAFLNKTGLSKNDVIGKKCYELKERAWLPCQTGDGQCPVERVSNTGESVEMTVAYGDGNHDSHEYLIIMYPLKVKAEVEGKKYFLEITREVTEYRHLILKLQRSEKRFKAILDLTRQRHLEKKMLQSERLAAVGQAVSHVAHEIKNPLMIIGGFTSQIRSSLQGEKDINKIDMVLDEVARLERLIANLGDFTKEYKLVMRPSEINSVVTDVLNIMAGVYSQENYCFEKYLSREINEINCDPDKLKQVFINIISNGTEAMPGGGLITVKTQKINDGIEVRISDEGRGMSSEELKKIFEPFYTTREKGTGLGLAISYKIIQAHKGEIWAVSTPGKGSTFIIQIPDSL